MSKTVKILLASLTLALMFLVGRASVAPGDSIASLKERYERIISPAIEDPSRADAVVIIVLKDFYEDDDPLTPREKRSQIERLLKRITGSSRKVIEGDLPGEPMVLEWTPKTDFDQSKDMGAAVAAIVDRVQTESPGRSVQIVAEGDTAATAAYAADKITPKEDTPPVDVFALGTGRDYIRKKSKGTWAQRLPATIGRWFDAWIPTGSSGASMNVVEHTPTLSAPEPVTFGVSSKKDKDPARVIGMLGSKSGTEKRRKRRFRSASGRSFERSVDKTGTRLLDDGPGTDGRPKAGKKDVATTDVRAAKGTLGASDPNPDSPDLRDERGSDLRGGSGPVMHDIDSRHSDFLDPDIWGDVLGTNWHYLNRHSIGHVPGGWMLKPQHLPLQLLEKKLTEQCREGRGNFNMMEHKGRPLEVCTDMMVELPDYLKEAGGSKFHGDMTSKAHLYTQEGIIEVIYEYPQGGRDRFFNDFTALIDSLKYQKD